MVKGNKYLLAAATDPLAQKCAGDNCGFEDLLKLFGRIFDFLLYIAVPLATLAIGYAGFLYLTSSTNEGNRSRAKEILKNAVIGIVLTLAAYVIVKSLLTLIGADSAFTNFIE